MYAHCAESTRRIPRVIINKSKFVEIKKREKVRKTLFFQVIFRDVVLIVNSVPCLYICHIERIISVLAEKKSFFVLREKKEQKSHKVSNMVVVV